MAGARNRARRWAAAGAALALVVCGTADAGTAFDASALRRELASHGFSPEQTQGALGMLESADARALPPQALESRIREGLARRAAPATILRVLSDRLAQLVTADEIARRCAPTGQRDAALSRLADSLAMGARRDDVLSLVPSGPGTRRPLDGVSHAAEVMGRLAGLGFASAQTRATLQAALEARWSNGRMDGLVAAFVEARGVGIGTEAAGRTFAEGIRGGRELSALVASMKEEARSVGAAAAPPAAGSGRVQGARPKSAPADGSRAHGRTAPPRAPVPHARTPHAPARPPHSPAPRVPRAPGPRPAPHVPRVLPPHH